MQYGGDADPTALDRARDSILLAGAYFTGASLEVRPLRCGKGRGLFAAAAFPRGAALLVERAALFEAAGALCAPSLTPDEVDALLYQLAPFHGTPGGCGALPALPRAELARRVLSANSFGVGAAAAGSKAAGFAQGGEGRALFPGIAMVNHDCNPNARTFQEAVEEGGVGVGGDDGAPRRVLEARRDIAAGEEITISYVPTTWVKAARAARLGASWGFACACTRCAAAHDDSLAARCRACGGAGRVFDGAPACADCGAAAGLDAQPPAGAEVAEALCAPGRPRELVARLAVHPALRPEDARVWCAMADLLPMLTPAPALAAELRDCMAAAAARMPWVDAPGE
jgi:hypothetical protein